MRRSEMLLANQTYGVRDDNPIIIAHGLFGSARNWRAIAKRLALGRFVICVDMRNHGASAHVDQMSYADMAGDLAHMAREFGGNARIIGHSMGGKATMLAALAEPDAIRGVLIADIAPVPYTHSAENRRYIEIMQSVDLAQISSRSDLDAALAAHLDDKSLRAFFAQSLDLSGNAPRWVLNLPVLHASIDDIVGFPDVGGTYTGPALFLAGATSPYVTDDGKTAARHLFPSARFASLKDAGHWLHAENPRGFIASCEAWLDATSS
jgi:pimeloyl-ACP methyl ester carboxylesterase